MNIYLFCQNKNYFSKSQVKAMKKTGRIIFVEGISPIGSCKKLVTDKSDKIIAIDPDVCLWKLTNKEIDSIPSLKAIIIQSTSFSWIDTDFCRMKKITVINTRDYCTNAVAEWLLMMTLMVARKLPIVYKDGWKVDFNRHLGMELNGKTAGIIGMGTIGTRVAQVMKAVGMKVVYWSKHDHGNTYDKITLAKLFKTADFIYPCLAKNIETTKIIQKKHLLSLKKTANIICAVPQPLLFDKETVLNLVAKNKMNGFGFESGGDTKKLMKEARGNTLITPELAWYTKETLIKNAEKWSRNIISAARNKYPDMVDP